MCGCLFCEWVYDFMAKLHSADDDGFHPEFDISHLFIVKERKIRNIHCNVCRCASTLNEDEKWSEHDQIWIEEGGCGKKLCVKWYKILNECTWFVFIVECFMFTEQLVIVVRRRKMIHLITIFKTRESEWNGGRRSEMNFSPFVVVRCAVCSTCALCKGDEVEIEKFFHVIKLETWKLLKNYSLSWIERALCMSWD